MSTVVRSFVFFLTLVVWPGVLLALCENRAVVDSDSTSFPKPNGVDNLMFYIQRDPNANTICYALNLDHTGKPDHRKPMDIFWMRYAEDGRRQDLNYIQRVFAYGIKIKKADSHEIEFRSVAYDKLPMYIRKGPSGYRVEARIGGEVCTLQRIYVRIDGGSFLSPNVLYVQLEGVNARGKLVVEQIKP